MTAPTRYRHRGDSPSRVARLPYGDLNPGGVDVHVWRSEGSTQITLNLEEYDVAEVGDDVFAHLSIDNARALVLALGLAIDDAVGQKFENDAKEAAARHSDELTQRRATAPVVGDVVLIGPDPSVVWPTDRPADETGNLTRDFGGRWGEVELVNYDFGHRGTPVSASELRAYVRVGKDDGSRGMARWIHVDYLTPVAVMARTRATATKAEATVAAEAVADMGDLTHDWSATASPTTRDEGFGVF